MDTNSFSRTAITLESPSSATRRKAPCIHSLTLHAPSGKRLVGFDNAHLVRRLSGRFKRRSAGADHWHRDAADKGRPYEFKSPELLLEDFFHEVDRVLGQLGVDVARVEMRKR